MSSLNPNRDTVNNTLHFICVQFCKKAYSWFSTILNRLHAICNWISQSIIILFLFWSKIHPYYTMVNNQLSAGWMDDDIYLNQVLIGWTSAVDNVVGPIRGYYLVTSSKATTSATSKPFCQFRPEHFVFPSESMSQRMAEGWFKKCLFGYAPALI